MSQLTHWAKKNTTEQDVIVLEASGNSFQVVRTLAALGRQALVLESCQMGKLKEAHANNDQISAVRIGKAYLAGTAKIVWVPDTKTRRAARLVPRPPQSRQTHHPGAQPLPFYLSDNGVRLKAPRWPKARPSPNSCAPWPTGPRANGSSSRGCSWSCATPMSSAPIGAA